MDPMYLLPNLLNKTKKHRGCHLTASISTLQFS